MKNTPQTAHASLAALAREASIQAHIILDSLIQGDLPISDKGLSNFSRFYDVAWMFAGKTLKSPPKALIQSRELLMSWQSGSGLNITAEELMILCKGIGIADSLWRQASPSMLLDVVIMLRSQIQEVEECKNAP